MLCFLEIYYYYSVVLKILILFVVKIVWEVWVYLCVRRTKQNLSACPISSDNYTVEMVAIGINLVNLVQSGRVLKPVCKFALEKSTPVQVMSLYPRPPIYHDTQIVIIIYFIFKLNRLNG